MKELFKKAIRFFRPLYWPFIRAYYRFLSPETKGVRIVLTNSGEVLFLKNSYGLKYNFPGGNLGKYEDPLIGGIREIEEEVGVTLTNLKFLGTIVPPLEFEYRKNTISIFIAELPTKNIQIDNLEISDFKWLPPSSPPSMGHVATLVFEYYLEREAK